MNRRKRRKNYSAAGFTAGLLVWFGVLWVGVLLAGAIGGPASTAGIVVFLLFFIGAFAAMIYVWRRWGLREEPYKEVPPDAPSRPSVPQAVRQYVFDRDGRRCVRCGAVHDLEIDHIIPLSLNGSNTEKNLQTLCATCNRRKGNRYVG